MMDEIMVSNLIGSDKFTELLARMPDGFFHLPDTTRQAAFGAIKSKILEGVNEVNDLVRFADAWLWIYLRIKFQTNGLDHRIR